MGGRAHKTLRGGNCWFLTNEVRTSLCDRSSCTGPARFGNRQCTANYPKFRVGLTAFRTQALSHPLQLARALDRRSRAARVGRHLRARHLKIDANKEEAAAVHVPAHVAAGAARAAERALGRHVHDLAAGPHRAPRGRARGVLRGLVLVRDDAREPRRERRRAQRDSRAATSRSDIYIIPIPEIWGCVRALLTSDRACSGDATVRRVDARRDGQVKSAGEPAGREGAGAPETAGLLDRGVAPEAADGPHLCV